MQFILVRWLKIAKELSLLILASNAIFYKLVSPFKECLSTLEQNSYLPSSLSPWPYK